MNTTIASNGLPALPQTKTNQAGTGSQASTTAASGSASPQTGDSVKLTDSARALQASGASTQIPVDTAKIAQIRQSLHDGSYPIDASKIADRLILLESQISATP